MTKFIDRAKQLFRQARDKLLEPKTKKMIVKGIRRGVDTIIQTLPFSQKTKALFRKYKNQIDQNGLESLKKIGQNLSVGQIKQAVQVFRDQELSKQQKMKRMKSLSTKILEEAISDRQILAPEKLDALMNIQRPTNVYQTEIRRPGGIIKRQNVNIDPKDEQIRNMSLTQ